MKTENTEPKKEVLLRPSGKMRIIEDEPDCPLCGCTGNSKDTLCPSAFHKKNR